MSDNLIKAIRLTEAFAAWEMGVCITGVRCVGFDNRWCIVTATRRAYRRVYVVDCEGNGYVVDATLMPRDAHDEDMITYALDEREQEAARVA